MTGPGAVPTSYPEFGPLARHLRFVERSSRRLARQTFYGMSRWQAKMEHHQRFLGRVVDIGAELFAMAASCVRAEMLLADDPQQGRSAQRLADAFCGQARQRVEVLFDELWSNTDDTDRKLAAAVLAGDVTWLEEGVLDPSEGTGPVDRPVGAGCEHGGVGLARRALSRPALPRASSRQRRLRSSSAIWTALRAAPLRRLSPTTKRTRPLPSGAAWSARTRPT